MSAKRLPDFEDIEVWQDAQNLAVDVYGDFADGRDCNFVDQIKRAAVSVSYHIAEGAERSTQPDFAQVWDIGKGSTGEVRSMYRLADTPEIRGRKNFRPKRWPMQKYFPSARRLG